MGTATTLPFIVDDFSFNQLSSVQSAGEVRPCERGGAHRVRVEPIAGVRVRGGRRQEMEPALRPDDNSNI